MNEALEEEEEVTIFHFNIEMKIINPTQHEVVAEEKQDHIKRGMTSHKLNVILFINSDIIHGNAKVVMVRNLTSFMKKI